MKYICGVREVDLTRVEDVLITQVSPRFLLFQMPEPASLLMVFYTRACLSPKSHDQTPEIASPGMDFLQVDG